MEEVGITGVDQAVAVGVDESQPRLEYLGVAVNRLIRLSYGPFQLLELKPGEAEPVRRHVLADQMAETLVPLAVSQRDNPTAFIENTEVFGDLATSDRFVEAYLWALESLHRDGARATLETLTGKESS